VQLEHRGAADLFENFEILTPGGIGNWAGIDINSMNYIHHACEMLRHAPLPPGSISREHFKGAFQGSISREHFSTAVSDFQ